MRLASTAGALVISQPVTDYIAEHTTESQDTKDDLLEAAIQGLVWAGSIFGATLVVRWIVNRRQ